MLGDLTKTQQNLSDYDTKLAKAIDEYTEAQLTMLRAVDAAKARIQRGQEVNVGKTTIEAQVMNTLAESMERIVGEALMQTGQHVSAASMSLYVNRRRASSIVLDIQKARE